MGSNDISLNPSVLAHLSSGTEKSFFTDRFGVVDTILGSQSGCHLVADFNYLRSFVA